MEQAPNPLRYATPPPPPGRRRPIIDISLAISCGLCALVLTFVVFVAVPNFERTFRDFGTQLPWFTVAVLWFSRFCIGGGIVLVWMGFAAIPFLSPLLAPWPPPDGFRRYFRRSRLLMTLFLTVLFGWIILGLFIPYVRLIDTVSNPGK